MAWAETYLRAKWHLDPFNRLTTVYQCHRQDRLDSTDRTGQKQLYQATYNILLQCNVIVLDQCEVNLNLIAN